MALVPDIKNFISTIEIKGGASVAQSTWNKIAGMINFIGHRTHQEKVFTVNGNYSGVPAPILKIDGLAFFEFDAEIFNVWVYSIKAGTSGTTELDLKIKPKLSGSFTSIFSTTPKFTPASGNNKWMELGDSGAGIVAPVLNSVGAYQVNRGDAITLDLIQSMAGGEHCGVVIHFRPR